MATVPYATTEQLDDWLPEALAGPDDAARLLVRASEAIDSYVIAQFSIDTISQLPKDADVATALSEATCAQVEFWLEVGEEHDVDGVGGSISVPGATFDSPPTLAPRARVALKRRGLMDLGWIGT